MTFHDPSRSKLANWRPCWLDSHIALPPLQLEPHPSDEALVVVSVCHGARGVWLSKDIPLTSLIQIFHFWSEDPEGTFMSLFGLNDWPRKANHHPVQQTKVPVPIEELI